MTSCPGILCSLSAAANCWWSSLSWLLHLGVSPCCSPAVCLALVILNRQEEHFIPLHGTCTVYIIYGFKVASRSSVIFLDHTVGSYSLLWCTNIWNLLMLWPRVLKNPLLQLGVSKYEMVLSRADARRGSKVSENILAYLHFKRVQNQLLWGELERKLIQNKTEKLTFKLEFVWAVTTASHPLRAQGSSKLSGWNWFLNQEVKKGGFREQSKECLFRGVLHL